MREVKHQNQTQKDRNVETSRPITKKQTKNKNKKIVINMLRGILYKIDNMQKQISHVSREMKSLKKN